MECACAYVQPHCRLLQGLSSSGIVSSTLPFLRLLPGVCLRLRMCMCVALPTAKYRHVCFDLVSRAGGDWLYMCMCMYAQGEAYDYHYADMATVQSVRHPRPASTAGAASATSAASAGQASRGSVAGNPSAGSAHKIVIEDFGPSLDDDVRTSYVA